MNAPLMSQTEFVLPQAGRMMNASKLEGEDDTIVEVAVIRELEHRGYEVSHCGQVFLMTRDFDSETGWSFRV